MSTILLVDDDALFRAITRRQLQDLGFEVVENDSGKGAMAQIRERQPVACLIDLVMDEQEGIETICEIAEHANRPKVVAVSSNPKYLDLAASLGADVTLCKPISPEVLRTTLSQLGIASV
jgi:CheY-like chemotaxis protein